MEKVSGENETTTILDNGTTMSTQSNELPKDIPKPHESEGWFGLDSTQILVLFIIIVFSILVTFLLLYYCIVRSMRRSGSTGRLGQKSISGSINEAKERNIFDHPERQLAVDSSVRMTPNSTASSEADRSSATSSQANLTSASPRPPQADQHNPQQTRKSMGQNEANQVTSYQSKKIETSNQLTPNQSLKNLKATSSQLEMSQPRKLVVNASQVEAIQTLQKRINGNETAAQPAPSVSHSRKSGSDSKKRKSNQQADPHSILGALAGLRDTLKDTETNK